MKKIYLPNILSITAGAAVWTFFVYLLIWHLNYFVGIDAYYHIKIAEIMKDNGLVLGKFPWADCSIWKDSFFDKDWLFHIFLIPFLYFGKLAGGKLAVLTAVFVAGVSWGSILRELKVKYIFCTMILICGCYGFTARLIMCRGHLFSVILLPLCLLLIMKRRKILLLIATFIYALSYTGAWQVIPIAILYDLNSFLSKDKEINTRNMISFYPIMAILLSFFINPFFPNNIYGFFVQNYIVLKTSWFGAGNVKFDLGREFNPMTDKRLFMHYPVFIILIILSYGVYAKGILKSFAGSSKYPSMTEGEGTNIDSGSLLVTNRGQRWILDFLFQLSVIYLILSFLSIKFSDYSVPLSFLFMSVLWSRYSETKNYKIRVYLITVLSGIIGFITVFHYSSQPPKRVDFKYADAAAWLNEQEYSNRIDAMNPQTIVFTAGWDDAPMLFYGAPSCRYLVFLDPCFMYTYSPEKYKKWYKISQGRALCPVKDIKSIFKAKYIFIPEKYKRLDDEIKNNQNAELVFEGRDGEKIYQVSGFIPGVL